MQQDFSPSEIIVIHNEALRSWRLQRFSKDGVSVQCERRIQG